MKKSMLQQIEKRCCRNERSNAAAMSKWGNRSWEWIQVWVNECCSNANKNRC
jgi:hypothetical protein